MADRSRSHSIRWRRATRLVLVAATAATFVSPISSMSSPTALAAECPGARVSTDSELSSAIRDANACAGPETILVDPGTYAPFEYTVTDELTIEARDQAATTFQVDGETGFQNQNRPFDVIATSFTLRGIRMEQRNAGKIGYVRVVNGRLELDDVDLVGTFGDEAGGGWGIDATDSVVVVSDSELASMDGSGLDVEGGSLTMTNVYVHDGYTTGVFVREAPVTIARSRLVANGRGNGSANAIDISNGSTGPHQVTIGSTYVSGHPNDGIVIWSGQTVDLRDLEVRGSSSSDTGLTIGASPGFSVTDSSFQTLATGVAASSDGSFAGVTITENSVAGIRSANTNELQFANSAITANTVDCSFDRGSFAVDNGGNEDSDGTCGFAANTPPTVAIGASPRVSIAPIVVNITAAATDSDGSVAGYLWDGATTPVAASNQRFAYTAPGTYEVSVQAIDDDGALSERATATIVVLPEPAPQASVVELSVAWASADERPGSEVRFSNSAGVHAVDLRTLTCLSGGALCSGPGVVPPSDGEPYAIDVTGLPAGWTWQLGGDCAPGIDSVPGGWFDVLPSSSSTCEVQIRQPVPAPPDPGAAEVTFDVSFTGDWAGDAAGDPTVLLQGSSLPGASCSPLACSVSGWWDATSATTAPNVEIESLPANWFAVFGGACSGLTTGTATLIGTAPGATRTCTIELTRGGDDPVPRSAGRVDLEVVWQPLSAALDQGVPGTGLRLDDGATAVLVDWVAVSSSCDDPGGPCEGSLAVPGSVVPGYLPSVIDLPDTWSTVLHGDCAFTTEGGAAADGSTGWFTVAPGNEHSCRIELIEHPSAVPSDGALLDLTVQWDSDQQPTGANVGGLSLDIGTAPQQTDLDALLRDRTDGSACTGTEAIVNGCHAEGISLPDLDGGLTILGFEDWTPTYDGDCGVGGPGANVVLAPATRAVCVISFVNDDTGTAADAGVVAFTVNSPLVPSLFSSIELVTVGGTTSIVAADLWSGLGIPCDTAEPSGCFGSVAAPPATYAVDVSGLPPGWTFSLSGDCAYEASTKPSQTGWFQVDGGARSTCNIGLIDTGGVLTTGRPTTDLALTWIGAGEFDTTAPDAVPSIDFSDGSGSITDTLSIPGVSGPCSEPEAIDLGCSAVVLHDVGQLVDLDANAAWLPLLDGRCVAVGQAGEATVVELLTGIGERATCAIILRQIAESEPIPAPTALLQVAPDAGDVPLEITLDSSLSGPVNTIESYTFSFTGESFDADDDPIAAPTPFDIVQTEPVLVTTLPDVAPATRWFVTVTTTDLFGRSTVSGIVTIEAGPVPGPRPPEATDDTFKIDLATTLDVAAPGVLANDDEGDAAALVTSETPPAHAASFDLSADGSFSYTPTPDFVGTDTFEYRVFSDLGSDVGLVSIDVVGLAGDVSVDVGFLGGPLEEVAFDASVSFPNAVSAIATEPLTVDAGWPFADPAGCSGSLSDWFEFFRPGCVGTFAATIGSGEILTIEAVSASDFRLPLYSGDCTPTSSGVTIDLDATPSPACQVSMVRTIQGDSSGAALHLTQRWFGDPANAVSPDVTITTVGATTTTFEPAPLDVEPILDAACPPPVEDETSGEALAACLAAIADCPSHDAGCQAFVALPVGDGAAVSVAVAPVAGWQTYLSGDCGPGGALGPVTPGTLVACELVHVESTPRGGVLFEWNIDPDEAFFGPLGPRSDINVDVRLFDGSTTIAKAAYGDAMAPQDQPGLSCAAPDTTADDLPATCRLFVPVDAGLYSVGVDNSFADAWDAVLADDCMTASIEVVPGELAICTIDLTPTRPPFNVDTTVHSVVEGTGTDARLDIVLTFDDPRHDGFELEAELLTGNAYIDSARSLAMADQASFDDVTLPKQAVTIPAGTLRDGVALDIVADDIDENDEGFVVAIGEIGGGPRVLVHVAIEDDDSTPTIDSLFVDFDTGPSPIRNEFVAVEPADDDGDIVEYRWTLQPSGQTWTTGAPKLDIVMTDVGTNTMSVVAVDTGGNTSVPVTADVVVDPTALVITPAVAIEGEWSDPVNRPWSVSGELARPLELELRVTPTGVNSIGSRRAELGPACTTGLDAAVVDTSLNVNVGPTKLPIVVCRDSDVERDATLLAELIVIGPNPGDEMIVLSRTLTIRDDDRYDLEPIVVRERDLDLSFVGNDATALIDDGRPPWYLFPPEQLLLVGSPATGNGCSPALGGTGLDVGLRIVGTSSLSAAVQPGGGAVEVVACGDTVPEPPGVYDLVLVAPDGSVDSTIVTVLDNDAPPVITTSSVQVEESSGTSVRKIAVGVESAPYLRSVFVATPPSGDATPGPCFPPTIADYQPLLGAVVEIPAGASSFDVSISICGDTLVDGDGSFSLLVARPPSNPEQLVTPEPYATIAVEIVDVNAPKLFVADVAVDEGTGGTSTAVITVTATGAGAPVGLGYATAPGGDAPGGAALPTKDYTHTEGSLTPQPTPWTRTIEVPIVGDVLEEGDQAFLLTITSNDAGVVDGTAEVTILDDDDILVNVSDASVTEGESVDLVVELSNPSEFPIVVTWGTGAATDTATEGDDYQEDGSSVLFSPGVTVRTIGIDTFSDGFAEGDETFTIAFETSRGAMSEASIVVTILDDGPPGISRTVDLVVVVPDGTTGLTKVGWTVTAFDVEDGDVDVECDPSSGAGFELGTTRVECVAEDSAGNADVETFDVTVVEEKNALAVLIGADQITQPGDDLQIRARDLEPFEPIQIELRSDPIVLGVFNADADGVLDVTVSIPADTPLGDHNIVLVPLDENSTSSVIVFPITIAEQPVDTLPATGSSTLPLVPIAFVTLLVGLLALAVSRRPSRRALGPGVPGRSRSLRSNER